MCATHLLQISSRQYRATLGDQIKSRTIVADLRELCNTVDYRAVSAMFLDSYLSWVHPERRGDQRPTGLVPRFLRRAFATTYRALLRPRLAFQVKTLYFSERATSLET